MDARVPISTRSIVACRAPCQSPGCKALCGFESELPYDSLACIFASNASHPAATIHCLKRSGPTTPGPVMMTGKATGRAAGRAGTAAAAAGTGSFVNVVAVT